MSPSELAEWIPVAPWAVGFIAVLALMGWVVFKFLPLLRRFARFLDDVAGEPERPGFAARPGLMERMATQEADMALLSADMAHIKHEVTYNHGTSMKDALRRVEAGIITVDTRLSDHLALTATKPLVQQVVSEKEVIVRGDS